MSKTLSAKYYQENKAREIFLKNKKKKSDKMVVTLTKISQKMKNKSVEYRKKCYTMRKNALL